jgi:uncharacterized metal-binding protein
VPSSQPHLDIRHHSSLSSAKVDKHFSVELFFKCIGTKDIARYLLMAGRYSLLINRENSLVAVFSEGCHDLHVRVCPVQYDRWTHVALTFDGCTLRCFVDSLLRSAVEVAELLALKETLRQREIATRKGLLVEGEVDEKNQLREKTDGEASKYFLTKEGVSYLKKASQDIMESVAFQLENVGDDAKDQVTALKVRRLEAMKRAKARYCEESYDAGVREIAEKYKLLHAELDDALAKEESDGKVRVFNALRVGAASATASTLDGSNYFHGYISLLSIYNHCLSADRVRAHFFSGSPEVMHYVMH